METSDNSVSPEIDDESEDKDLVPQEEVSPKAEKTKKEKAEELLKVLPPEELRLLLEVSRTEGYVGPLPPPEFLRQYDELVPGSAAIIINQFASQGDHRRELEKHVIEGDVRRANWGLVTGATLGLIGIVGSIILIGIGKEVAGIIALLSSLSPIVGSLVFVNVSRRKERSLKEAAVPETIPNKPDHN